MYVKNKIIKLLLHYTTNTTLSLPLQLQLQILPTLPLQLHYKHTHAELSLVSKLFFLESIINVTISDI